MGGNLRHPPIIIPQQVRLSITFKVQGGTGDAQTYDLHAGVRSCGVPRQEKSLVWSPREMFKLRSNLVSTHASCTSMARVSVRADCVPVRIKEIKQRQMGFLMGCACTCFQVYLDCGIVLQSQDRSLKVFWESAVRIPFRLVS